MDLVCIEDGCPLVVAAATEACLKKNPICLNGTADVLSPQVHERKESAMRGPLAAFKQKLSNMRENGALSASASSDRASMPPAEKKCAVGCTLGAIGVYWG